MSEIVAMLDHAHDAGLHIRLDGDVVFVQGPATQRALAQQLLARKTEVVETLRGNTHTDGDTARRLVGEIRRRRIPAWFETDEDGVRWLCLGTRVYYPLFEAALRDNVHAIIDLLAQDVSQGRSCPMSATARSLSQTFGVPDDAIGDRLTAGEPS